MCGPHPLRPTSRTGGQLLLCPPHNPMPSTRDARVAAAVDALATAVASARGAPPASDKLRATAVAVLTREVPQVAGRWSRVREGEE